MAGELVEVARFKSADDVRVVRMGRAADGPVTVEEIVTGPSCLLAYGESSHVMRVVLSGGVAGSDYDRLTKYLQDQDHALVDLMDLCDRMGVTYAFMGLGDASGIHFRPAGPVGE